MKIFATLVVNSYRFLEGYLSHVGEFCDGVVCYIDRADKIVSDTLKSSLQVRFIHVNTEYEFNETNIRNMLYEKAYQLGANWVILLDVDERMDENFIQKICNNKMPHACQNCLKGHIDNLVD